jgi:hypothetical protein
MLSQRLSLPDFVADAFVTKGYFGNQNDIGPSRYPGIERDPAGVAAHYFQDHDAAVTFSRRMKSVDRIGGTCHCGIESERPERAFQVVVDRLRNTNDRNAVFMELLSDA